MVDGIQYDVSLDCTNRYTGLYVGEITKHYKIDQIDDFIISDYYDGDFEKIKQNIFKENTMLV